MGESLCPEEFSGAPLRISLSWRSTQLDDFPDFKGSVKVQEAITDYEHSYS